MEFWHFFVSLWVFSWHINPTKQGVRSNGPTDQPTNGPTNQPTNADLAAFSCSLLPLFKTLKMERSNGKKLAQTQSEKLKDEFVQFNAPIYSKTQLDTVSEVFFSIGNHTSLVLIYKLYSISHNYCRSANDRPRPRPCTFDPNPNPNPNIV